MSIRPSDTLVHVPGVGPAPARLMFVGESPGREEVKYRDAHGVARPTPFVGSAGRLLNHMLAAAGIQRDQTYVTNVVKVRPPANVWERLGELGLTVSDFIPELTQEIHTVNPYVIVALGDRALEHLTGRKGIMHWRGSILDCRLAPGVKVIPTLHPAYVLRDYSMHPVVIMDLLRAKREGRKREHTAYTPHLILQPSLNAILEYIQRCHQTREFAFDIETLGPRIRCLALAADESSAICIPLKRGPVNVWPQGDEDAIWFALRRLFTDPSVLKIGQNMQFDLSHLVPHTGFPAGPLFDTLLAHHLVAPELPHDLDFLASIYTDIGYYGIGNVARAGDMDTWVYNMKDALATIITAHALMSELRERKLTAFFQGYTMALSVALWEMQQSGVCIDVEARRRLITDLESELSGLTDKLEVDASGTPLNPNSPLQLRRFFYEQQGAPVILHRKRGTPTVDRDALQKLAAKGSQAAGTILSIRARQKLISTFLDVPLAPDGRLHTEYVISGTVSGRLSSRAPYTGFGTNLQNIPDAARSVFIPAPGCVFIKGDLSQAENRDVAWRTRGLMKEAFLRGEDVHMLTASMLGVDRELAKRVNHASNYGLGPGQLAVLLGIGRNEATRLLGLYHGAYPEVREWHQRIQRQLQRNRTLINAFGRPRVFLGRWSDDLFRSAYAQLPQSDVADLLNTGLVNLWLALRELPFPARIVLQVHDELVCEAPREHAEPVRQLMYTHLERPFEVEGDPLMIPLVTRVLHENWLN